MKEKKKNDWQSFSLQFNLAVMRPILNEQRQNLKLNDKS